MLTNKDIADSRQEQMEDHNRELARQNPRWRSRHAEIEAIAQRQIAQRAKDHPTDHDSALAAFDKRNPDIIAHPGAKIRAFQAYEAIKDRAARGEAVDWHGELTKAEQSIRHEIGWTKSEEQVQAERIAEMRKARGQE